MARAPREWLEGGIYHLFSRGSDRRPLFEQQRDYFEFAVLMADAAVRDNVDCFAWCLMPNHWHVVARSPAKGLSTFMKRVNHRYSLRFNRRHGRTAHLFKNRFGAVLQTSEDQFLWTVRYVLRNPVTAGACSSVRDAQWTSYPAMVGRVPAPPFLRREEILERFAGPDRDAIAAFEAFLQA